MTGVDVTAETSTQEVLGKLVSDVQSDVSIASGVISGTLKYVTDYTQFSGEPELQQGNFLILKFNADDWSAYTSVKVGLVPSAIGMDLVEIKDDPDKNGVYRVTDAATQKFKVVATDGDNTTTQIYSLVGLRCLSE